MRVIFYDYLHLEGNIAIESTFRKYKQHTPCTASWVIWEYYKVKSVEVLLILLIKVYKACDNKCNWYHFIF